MKIPTLICLTLAACICTSHAQSLKPAKLQPPPKLGSQDGANKKVRARFQVLQILEEGLLVITDTKTYLLVGHPDEKKVADGDWVAAWVVDTGKLFKYEAVAGSEKTVHIYKYAGPWSGR